MAAMNWLQKISQHLVHVTTVDNALEIAHDGLLPHPPDYGNDVNWAEQQSWPDGGIEDRSYFGNSVEGVEMFSREGEPVYLRVPQTYLEQCGLGQDCDWFITKPVPPEHIEIKQGNQWMPLLEWARSVGDH